jgi:hypothetical protein
MSVGPEAQLHFQRGNAAFKQRAYEEAAIHYSRAIQIASDFGDALFNRAQVHRKLRNPKAAIADFERALPLLPRNAAAFLSYGEFLLMLRRPLQALSPLGRAAQLQPDLVAAHTRLGSTLRALLRPQEALVAFEKALSLAPGDRGLTVQKATCQLMSGDFTNGWRTYEARIEFNSRFGRRGFAQPAWLGESDIAGKTILVHAEQGLGDTLQFCRYLPLLEAAGAHVLFAPQLPLKSLMRSLSSSVDIVDIDDPALRFDVHCRLLSLPLAFGTTLDTVPAKTPYLTAEPTRVGAWRQKLGSQGMKIGVCWQGSSEGQRLGRSFAPDAFAGIASVPGVRLIGLQRGNDPKQLDLAQAAAIEMAGDYFAKGEDDFLDAAAIIKACDLIITADTATLHLAGALNHSVWAPLNANADWRWGTEGSKSSWYPSLRLFRSTQFDNLQDAFSEMEEILRGDAAS